MMVIIKKVLRRILRLKIKIVYELISYLCTTYKNKKKNLLDLIDYNVTQCKYCKKKMRKKK